MFDSMLNADGYCYMRLFATSPVSVQRKLKKSLGKYPTLRSVCREIYHLYRADEEVLLPMLGIAPAGLMHVYGRAVNRKDLGAADSASYVTPKIFFELYFDSHSRLGGINGLCYVVWLQQAGINVVLQQRIVKRLGLYPFFEAVIDEILDNVKTVNVVLSSPRFVSGRLMHIETHYPTVSLVNLIWDRRYLRIRVGADSDISNELMPLFLDSVGLDYTAVANVVAESAIRLDPMMRQRVIDSVSHSVKARFEERGERLSIKYSLTDAEKTLLISAYPEFHLTWAKKNKVTHPHAMSAAARICETQYMLNALGYRANDSSLGHVALIKDVGGKPETHLHRGRLNVHVCAPILDHRDDQRHSRSVNAMANIAANAPPAVSKKLTTLLENPVHARAFLCRDRAQDCSVTAKSCIFVHSTYDMSLVDIANSMAVANAEGGMIAVLYSADMLVKTSGYLEYQRCNWDIVETTTTFGRKRKKIRFSFDNDSSFNYEHDYGQYVKLFCTCVLRSTDGVLYYSEMTNIVLDTAFLQLTRSKFSVPTSSVLRRSLYFPDRKDRTVVHTYRYYPAGTEKHLMPYYSPIDILVKTEIFEKVFAYAMDQAASRFSVAQIFSFAKSAAVRRVVNGTSVDVVGDMTTQDINDLSVAVFIMAFDQRFAASGLAKAATDESVQARKTATSSLTTIIADRVRGFFTSGNGPVVIDQDVETSISLYARMRAWFAKRRVLNVRTTKMITHMSVSTWLPPHAYDYLLDREPLTSAMGREVVPTDDPGLTGLINDAAARAMKLTDGDPDGGIAGGGAPDLTAGFRPALSVCPTCNDKCQWRLRVRDGSEELLRCLRSMERVDVLGDGNCFYYAVIAALNLPMSVSDLKCLLMASPFLDTLCQAKAARELLTTPRAFADNSVFCLVMHELRVGVNLLMVSARGDGEHHIALEFRPDGTEIDFTISLMLRDQHYTVLKPPTDVVTVPRSRQPAAAEVTFADFRRLLCGLVDERFRGIVSASLDDGNTIASFCDLVNASVIGVVNYNVKDPSVIFEIIDAETMFLVLGGTEMVLWAIMENFLYSRVGECPARQWDETRHCRSIRGFGSRAALKFYEILRTHQIHVEGQGVLDLGGAPGAVYEMLTAMKPSRLETYSTPSPPGLKYWSRLASSPGVHTKAIESVVFDREWNLVLADCGTATSYTWEESHELFLLQLEKVMSALLLDGTAVIKHANFLSFLHHIDYYSKFFCEFSSISMEKPYLANPNTTEVYIVCHARVASGAVTYSLRNVDEAVERIVFGARRCHLELDGQPQAVALYSTLRSYVDDLRTRPVRDRRLDVLVEMPLVRFDFYTFSRGWYERVSTRVSPLDVSPVEDTVRDVLVDDLHLDRLSSGNAISSEPLDTPVDVTTPALQVMSSLDNWSLNASDVCSVDDRNFVPPGARPLGDCGWNAADQFLMHPECRAHDQHDQIVSDVSRSDFPDKSAIHRQLCSYFAVNGDYRYFQGMHYFAQLAAIVYPQTPISETLSKLFSSRLEALLTEEFEVLFHNETMLDSLISSFLEKDKDLVRMSVANLWTKLACTGAYDLTRDWSVASKKYVLERFTVSGIYTVLPFLRQILRDHRGAVMNMCMDTYLTTAYLKHDGAYWLDKMRAGILTLDADMEISSDGEYVRFRGGKSITASFASGLGKISAVVKREKRVVSMPVQPGQPQCTTSYPQSYKSEVKLGDRTIMDIGSSNYMSTHRSSVRMDPIDRELLDKSMVPVKRKIFALNNNVRSVVGEVKRLAPPASGSNPMDVLAEDIVSLESPSVVVCPPDTLIRDLLVVLVDVNDVEGSLSSYAWHSWMSNVSYVSLAATLRKSLMSLSTTEEGSYLALHLGDDAGARRLLVIILCNPFNYRNCLVKFITKFHADFTKLKNVPILQPRNMTCARMHALISETVVQTMKHRYRRIVPEMCSDDRAMADSVRTKYSPLTEASKIMHDNWRDKGVIDYKYNFSPRVFPATDADAKIKNSVSEIMDYWRVCGAIVTNNLLEFYKRMNYSDRVSRESIHTSSEGYAVFNRRTAKWLVRSAKQESDYEYCCDGVKLVPFAEASKPSSDVASDILVVSSDTALMQDSKLFQASRRLVCDLDSVSFVDYSVTLVSGVPGCGKTTEAINNFTSPTSGSSGDLILFPTKVASEDFRERLRKKYPGVTDEILRMHVMTVDSFLINDRRYPDYGKLIIDEALMLHCGAIFLAAMKAKTKSVYLIGDIKQIPWVNRTSLSISKHLVTDIVAPSKYLSVSYRCTVTTAALLSPQYENGMTAYGSQMCDMTYRVDPNPLSNHTNKDAHYLVFTQGDKKELMHRNKGLHVNTIHEYQGKEHKEIVLIRGSSKKLDLYSKKPYILVALSRHRVKFTYVTPVSMDDVICGMISRVNRMSKPELLKFSKMSAGFLPRDVVMVKLPENSAAFYGQPIASCSLNYGVANVSPYYPELLAVDETHVLPATRKVNTLAPSVQKLQAYYDEIFPGNSTHDLRFDPYHVLNSPLECHVERTTVDSSRVVGYGKSRSKYDNLAPLLRTSMAVTRPSNQIESLLGMIKRNQAAPQLVGLQDPVVMAEILETCFCSTYIRPDCRELFASYPDDPIQCDPSAISEWLDGQPSGTVSMIERYEFPHESNFTKYNYMIKNKVKPQLDVGAPYTYSAVQTIAYQKKNVNVLFCPIFRYMRRRLLPIMKKKFMVYTDVSADDFARKITEVIGARVMADENFLEVDISKYDKSQSRVVLLFECSMMRRFGVPKYWVDLWWGAHETTTLVDRVNGLSCNVDFQRKSGDASTFFGNTMFLMALMASLYDLNKVDFACFAGDDSLIVGGPDLQHDYSSQCGDLFNLESKFLRCYKYKNFCSKFFLPVDTHVFLVPDPVKLLTKLGRHDVVNWKHLEEFRVSMVDVTRQFGDARVCEELSRAVMDRYQLSIDVAPMIESLYTLFQDTKLLGEFFALPLSGMISNDPTLPKFD